MDRISAIVHSRPAQARAGEERSPAPGESLLLTYSDAEGADLLATMSNGTALRLAGQGRWQRDLQPGDLLRVRVLASEPMLELELDGAPIRGASSKAGAADADASSMNRHAAMRLDQAALRQMAWQAPNAAALALSWRDLARQRWGGRMSIHEMIGEAPAATLTTMLGPAPFREPSSALPPPLLERWLLPVYAWGGMQMLLWLVESEDEASNSARPRQRRSTALRLELAPAALGRVVLQVQWLPGGIELLIAVEHPEAARHVHDALPTITTALSGAGLRLTRFRLTQFRLAQGSAAVSMLRDIPRPTHARFAGEPSSLALFRALAETAVVLLQVVPQEKR